MAQGSEAVNARLAELVATASRYAIHTYVPRSMFDPLPTKGTAHAADCPGCASQAAIDALVKELNGQAK